MSKRAKGGVEKGGRVVRQLLVFEQRADVMAVQVACDNSHFPSLPNCRRTHRLLSRADAQLLVQLTMENTECANYSPTLVFATVMSNCGERVTRFAAIAQVRYPQYRIISFRKHILYKIYFFLVNQPCHHLKKSILSLFG